MIPLACKSVSGGLRIFWEPSGVSYVSPSFSQHACSRPKGKNLAAVLRCRTKVSEQDIFLEPFCGRLTGQLSAQRAQWGVVCSRGTWGACEALGMMTGSLVSVRTPQEDVNVLRLCRISASRVRPPSSACLHQTGVLSNRLAA